MPRIVIPKAVREATGLRPGTPLALRVRDGRVEIEPAARAVKIVKRGAVRVAVPSAASEPLEAVTVTQAQRTLRNRHG